jgi:hypothetical protein
MEIKKCSKCRLRPAQKIKRVLKDGTISFRYHYCKECKREYARLWGQKNVDKVREWGRKSREKNKDVLKMQRKQQRWGLKIEVLTAYSSGVPTCACCGETHPEFLAIDHINNDGAEAKRNGEPKGGVGFYTYLRRNNYPTGFQVLCHNCNMAKAFYGVCPHQS